MGCTLGATSTSHDCLVVVCDCCSYTAEAPEMQMRRLADLAFMFQLYELAYQIYHAAKKDFNNEHAWLHFAGAMVLNHSHDIFRRYSI